jgi:FkbM family methyltransferase
MKKVTSIVKSIPIIGALLASIHGNIKLRPKYQYIYKLKPLVAALCINILRKLITFEHLIISREGCIISNGAANFRWDPKDPASLLGYPLRGDFEDLETRIAVAFAKKSNCVVDVGGNFGWYACQLRAAMPDCGEIHIFEPVPYEHAALTKNMALNGRDSVKTMINPVCLSDEPGEVTLHVPNKLGSAFASLAEQNYNSGFQRIIVRAETLDDYCQKNNVKQVDFLKIDVEGAELKVLQGATTIFNGDHKPAVLIESYQPLISAFNASVRDVIDFFTSYGYSGYLCHKNTLVSLVNVRDESGYDFLFIDSANATHTDLVTSLVDAPQ